MTMGLSDSCSEFRRRLEEAVGKFREDAARYEADQLVAACDRLLTFRGQNENQNWPKNAGDGQKFAQLLGELTTKIQYFRDVPNHAHEELVANYGAFGIDITEGVSAFMADAGPFSEDHPEPVIPAPYRHGGIPETTAEIEARVNAAVTIVEQPSLKTIEVAMYPVKQPRREIGPVEVVITSL